MLTRSRIKGGLMRAGWLRSSNLLLFGIALLVCRALLGPFTSLRHERTLATLESCDFTKCVAPPATLHVLHGHFLAWLSDQLSPACQKKCWSGTFRSFCQDCSDIDTPENEDKRRQCSMFCNAHGSCPLSGPLEKAHPACPAYDASLRDARVALLRSLGATVLPNANYGIDVHGIHLKEPWVKSHAGLLCAIHDLTADYLVVNFKGQDPIHCETDLDMCYTLGRAYEGKFVFPSAPQVHAISNHPQLGVVNDRAEDWHFDGLGEDLVAFHEPQASGGSVPAPGGTSHHKECGYLRPCGSCLWDRPGQAVRENV
eukprot:jgi/Mesvir1/18401/Mv14279-RA.2